MITDEDGSEYEIINLITNSNHDPSPTGAENVLFIACSGTRDNIAASEALTSLFGPHPLNRHDSEPYVYRYFSDVGLSIFSSNGIFEHIKSASKNLNIPMPILPNNRELSEAINELKGNAKRWYIDMRLDLHPLGYESAAIWNIFQRENKKEALMQLIKLQSYDDDFFREKVRDKIFTLLNLAYFLNQPYAEIISTQAVGLPGLCDAVIKYNTTHGANIVIHQYMTDLPTKGAVHFFHALSKLTPVQQQQMKLYAVNMNKEVLKFFFKQEMGVHFNGIYNIDPKRNPMIQGQITSDFKLN